MTESEYKEQQGLLKRNADLYSLLRASYDQGVAKTEVVMKVIALLGDPSLKHNEAAKDARRLLKKAWAP